MDLKTISIISPGDVPRIIENKLLVSFLNPYSYHLLRGFSDFYRGIDAWGCDGIVMVKLMGLFRSSVTRCSFDYSSIASSVFDYVADNKLKIYICGSTEENVVKFLDVLNCRHPGVNLIGYSSGYFDDTSYRKRILEIVDLAPDVVLAGMGTPRQENFLIDLRREGWRGAGFTCGGFIHQTAAAGGDYYPDFIDKYNLRFLYRAIKEPGLAKRYMKYYPLAMFHVVRDFLR